MKLAINQATTMRHSFEEDVAAYSAAGFTAVELWLDKVSVYLRNHSLAETAARLKDHGLKPVGACFHFGVMLSEGAAREKNLDEFRAKLEMCQALHVPVLVVPTDFPEREVVAADYDRAVEGLREAAGLAKPFGVSLAVEFIKGAKLIGTLRTAMELVRRVAADHVGILLDTFHFHAGASKLADLEALQGRELRLVHINDARPVPVEIIQDQDRIPLGEGVMDLAGILKAVAKTGYGGYYSLELFDEAIWRMQAKAAARILFAKTTQFFGNSTSMQRNFTTEDTEGTEGGKANGELRNTGGPPWRTARIPQSLFRSLVTMRNEAVRSVTPCSPW